MLIALVMIDVVGHGREKLYVNEVERGSFCSTALLDDSFGQTIMLPGFGHDVGHEDIVGVVDVRKRWTKNCELGLVRLVNWDGSPHALCVRGQLAESIASLADIDWTPVVGLELECLTLTVESSVQDDSPSVRRRYLYGPVIDDGPTGAYILAVVAAAEARGIGLQGANREIEQDQVEFITPPNPAMMAADDGYLLRRLLFDVGKDIGIRVVTAPQLREQGFGNGLHVNLSMRSISGRLPWSSEAAERCAAMMAGHLEDACALFVSNPDGYKRLHNAEFNGCPRVWSSRSRDALVRVISDSTGPRLEIRLPDPECNIHLAVAAILELARRGLQAADSDQPSPNVPNLPVSLPEALQRLEKSAAGAMLQKDLMSAYINLKRSEVRQSSLIGMA